MKIVIWAVFALLALLWTGTAAALASFAQWAATGLATGSSADLARLAEGWVLPAWLAPWIGADIVAALQDLTLASIEFLRGIGPWASSGIGWLVPLTWVVWGLGMLALLVLAGIGHGLVRLMSGPPSPPPAAPPSPRAPA